MKTKLVESLNHKTINLIQTPGKIVSESEVLVKWEINNANVNKIELNK